MKELTEKFIEGLRNHKTFIYFNLFSILGQTNPDFLEDIFKNFKEYPDDWFAMFHKSLRQWDFFNCDRISIIKQLITDEEMVELHDLQKVRAILRRRSLDYSTKPEYIETDGRFKELLKKKMSYERDGESITGHLDSILYETIANDKGELGDYMFEFLSKNIKNEENRV